MTDELMLSTNQIQSISKIQKESKKLTVSFCDEEGQALEVALEDDDDYLFVAEHLKSVKRYIKRVEEMKHAFVDPWRRTLRQIEERFKKSSDAAKSVESAIKEGMGAYVLLCQEHRQELMEEAVKNKDNDALAGALAYTQPLVDGISIRDNVQIEILDEKKIPREYLKPDEKKIKAVAKTGKDVPGVVVINKPLIAVTVKS